MTTRICLAWRYLAKHDTDVVVESAGVLFLCFEEHVAGHPLAVDIAAIGLHSRSVRCMPLLLGQTATESGIFTLTAA